MSRSSHLDHPGSQSSLFSPSFSPSLLNPWSGPNHPTQSSANCSALLSSRLAPEGALSFFFLICLSSLSPRFSSSFSFSTSFSFSLFFNPPYPLAALSRLLHTALKRQFPEIFPPWEESAFECGSWGFDTPAAGNFITIF